MASQQREEFQVLLIKTIRLLCQTLFYGVYVTLIPFSTHFLLKKRPMSRSNKFMFGITVFMFLLSTGYWAVSLGNLLDTINVFFSSNPNPSTVWTNLLSLFNSLVLINYVFTDCVVVWRAWVLCKFGGKKIFLVPMLFFLCTSLSVASTIAIRVTIVATEANLASDLDITQMTNLTLSLLTNIGATSIVAFSAWKHRQELRETVFKKQEGRTRVENILILLVESGFIYCISGILILIASTIRISHGTLGDVYTPIHTQIAGIYPTVILVLVSQKRSLTEEVFTTAGNITNNGALSQMVPMDFRTNPALSVSVAFDVEESRHIGVETIPTSESQEKGFQSV